MNFNVTVEYNNKLFEVDVVRTSTKVFANNYFGRIVVEENISNKYPQVVYQALNGTLVYVDSLFKLLPGFAELLKVAILKYLEDNGIEI